MYKESSQLEIIQKSEITETRRYGSVYLGVVVLYMGIHAYTWLYMALVHGITWLYMTIQGNTWLYMGIHGITWLYMAIHGDTW